LRAARTTDKKSLPPFAISDREQHARLGVNKPAARAFDNFRAK